MVGGPEQFSVSPRFLGFGFGTKGFGAKGLGPGLDNRRKGVIYHFLITMLCVKVLSLLILIQFSNANVR